MTSWTALGFALVTAVAWGVVLFARKRYFAEFRSTTFLAVAFGITAVWYAPLMIIGTQSPGMAEAVTPLSIAVVLAAIGVDALALYVLFKAISIGDVSYVAPVSKISPVFVVPIEVLLLGEILEPIQIVGVVVLTVAVYVANYDGDEAPWVPLQRAVRYRPGQLAIASAFFVAWYQVSQRFVLQELAIESTVWIGVKLAGVTLVLAPVALRGVDWTMLRGALPQFVVLGAILAVGEHFMGLAFTVLPASIATPVVNAQSIVAVLLGGLLLQEGNFRMRLVAAVTVVVGITLVAAP